MLVVPGQSLFFRDIISICSEFHSLLCPVCQPSFPKSASLWSSSETPWQTICAVLHSPRQRMPSTEHIKFVTNFKLGTAVGVSATGLLEGAGSTPMRPQPQYKQSIRNSSSQCSTDSKCLEKGLSKITNCNRISGKLGPCRVHVFLFYRGHKIKTECEKHENIWGMVEASLGILSLFHLWLANCTST